MRNNTDTQKENASKIDTNCNAAPCTKCTGDHKTTKYC